MFNYYSDGGNISLPQPRYSSDKADILKAHGIDFNNPIVPKDVLEVSSLIARKCNQELGIMCGIDFILNEEDNKWYYLEIQAFPAIEEWAVNKNIRIGKVNSVDDYLKYLTIELEARYDALILHMSRKLSNNEKEKIKIKWEMPFYFYFKLFFHSVPISISLDRHSLKFEIVANKFLKPF